MRSPSPETSPCCVPATDTTYRSRRCAAKSRVNCSKSVPSAVRRATVANKPAMSRRAICPATSSNVDVATSPSCVRTAVTVIGATESCSSMESASRMPPRA